MTFGNLRTVGFKLVLLLTLVSLVSAAVFVQPVDVKSKQCIWKKHVIADGDHLNLASPCMSLTCDAKLKFLRGASCGRVAFDGHPKNCTILKGKGVYPKCCRPQIVCH